MMTTEEIRAELQDVRYYYSRKAMFDRAEACVAKNAAVALAEKYGNAVRDAPPRLYDIYVTLYVENNTQASAAEKWGYSEGYIRYCGAYNDSAAQTSFFHKDNKHIWGYFHPRHAAARRKRIWCSVLQSDRLRGTWCRYWGSPDEVWNH